MATTPRMRIGQFYQQPDGSVSGKIYGLGFGAVEVASMDSLTFGNLPYLKLVANPGNDEFEIGAAFPKEKDGQTYYSVNIDSPMFPNPISGAMFSDRDDPQTMNLVWNRPEVPKPAVNANARAEVEPIQPVEEVKTEAKVGAQQGQKRGPGRRSPGLSPQ